MGPTVRQYAVMSLRSADDAGPTRLRNKRKIRNKQLGLYLKRDGLLSRKIRSDDEIRNGERDLHEMIREHFF